MNLKRVIEVVIRGSDTTGPLWSGLRTQVAGLTKNKMALAGAAAAVGTAIVAMLNRVRQKYDEAIETAGKFQKAVLEITTLQDSNTGSIGKLSRGLQELSVKYDQVDTIMARAQYNVASAGFTDVADAMHILDVSSRAAIGGITDVNTAAKTITQTLNAYGLGAGHAEEIAGYLFGTIKGGVTTFEELSGVLGKVTSVASVAGIPFEEVAAAMAVLTKNGANSAEAATALSALILSIGAASGDSKLLLDDLGISLEDGLGPALVAVSKASGGSLEALATLIPNVRAIRAAASAAGDEGKAFAEQLHGMASGAAAFNKAYNDMAQAYEHASDRSKAASERLKVAVGETGLAAKTAGLEGWTEYKNALAEAVEQEQFATVTLLGRLQGIVGKGLAAGKSLDVLVASILDTVVASSPFGLAALGIVEALDKIGRQKSREITESGPLLPLDRPEFLGPVERQPSLLPVDQQGPLGPFDPVRAEAEARAAADAALAAWADQLNVRTTDALFDISTMTFVDVPRAADAIAKDLNEAYAQALENLELPAPIIEKDFSAAGGDAAIEQELQLYEDLAAAEEERRAQLSENSEAEAEAALAQHYALVQAGDDADAHIARLYDMIDAQEELKNTVMGVLGSLESAGAAGIKAFLTGTSGAKSFASTLNGAVIDAISQVIAKLLIMKLLSGPLGLLMSNGGGVPARGSGGAMPRAAYGYSIPDHGGRPGLDSVPILGMPGEEVVDRSLSLQLRRFLATQDAAAVAPASTGGLSSRGAVNVSMTLARPIGYLDVLDLGRAAVHAAKKVSEAVL